jgi:NADPH:quinone reductase-like Zn-dependent oxidoreductase
MNAAVVQSFELPPRYESFADPAAGEGELIVHVSAAGLHQIVKSLASGKHYGSTGELPFVPGLDGVGRLEDGSRVYFGFSRSPFGTLAERGIAKRSMCLPLPEALDDATVAAMINPAMSSWAALTARIQFEPGESVLIHGATGVAGKLAIQIAKRLGAKRVVAAGRHQGSLEDCKSLGADAVVSLNQDSKALVASFQREFAENKIDVVLDYLWGNPAEQLLEGIAQKGLQQDPGRIRYLQVGSVAGPTISLPAATLRSSGLEMYGSGFGSVSIKRILQSLEIFLKEAATKPFQMKIKKAPLREVEALWNASEPGVRTVFQP